MKPYVSQGAKDAFSLSKVAQPQKPIKEKPHKRRPFLHQSLDKDLEFNREGWSKQKISSGNETACLGSRWVMVKKSKWAKSPIYVFLCSETVNFC